MFWGKRGSGVRERRTAVGVRCRGARVITSLTSYYSGKNNAKGLQQHGVRRFQELLERRQPRSTNGTVNNAVVTRQRD